MLTTPLIKPAPVIKPAPASADLDQLCELIDRLELHRTCLDEALADAYGELVEILGARLAADPDLTMLLAKHQR
jgi:hypothetical protein